MRTPNGAATGEFVQCDFDTIGTTSIISDIETALVIHDLFVALGLERFTVHISNRKVLSGLLDRLGLSDQSTTVLRSVDKLGKIGRAAVAADLTASAGATQAQIDAILELVTLEGDNREIVDALSAMLAGSATGEEGAAELSGLLDGIDAAGVGSERFRIDPSIARGLDYYTGMVYETFLDDLPEIGSCCSGGRYDNLASVYTSQVLPGVGASLGVDRLLAAMQQLGSLEERAATADVLVTLFDPEHKRDAVGLAADLRRHGVVRRAVSGPPQAFGTTPLRRSAWTPVGGDRWSCGGRGGYCSDQGSCGRKVDRGATQRSRRNMQEAAEGLTRRVDRPAAGRR